MNITECITTRRSIRKYKQQTIDHSLIEQLVSLASHSPSWKNTQITRYYAIEDSSIINDIVNNYTPEFNSNIVKQVPVLMAVTYIKERSGFERDGSFSTPKEDRWQMFDVGLSCQTFCLAAHDAGLGTVIMGIFNEDKITQILDLPDNEELMCLVALGYPDISPTMPARKSIETLLTYK